MRFDGRVVMITGAASDRGIGRAVAAAFYREGARLVLVDSDAAGVTEAARQFKNAVGIAADVSSRDQVRAAISQAVAAFGRIDVLVNNAGFCEFRHFFDIDDALWDRTMAVNLKGYFLCGQEVARHMVERGSGGKIVNISSVSAETSGEEKIHYSVTKAGIKSLTLGMSLELAAHRINVNAVAPGVIDTNIIKEPRIQRLVDYEREHPSAPLGRIGQAEDVAGAVLFLCSEDAAYITGATILVDGGSSAGTMMPKGS